MKLTIQTIVTACLLVASSAWASTPSFSGHVAYKNFESCSNGVFTGTGAYGGVACQNGKWGTKAGRFDGVNDGVSLADKPEFHMTDAMTVAAWVRPDTTTGQGTLAAKWYAMDSYRLAVDDGQYRFIVAFPGGTWGTKVAVEAPATAGVWTHVAGVYDGASVALYINGALAAETPASGTLQQSNRPLDIGNHPSWAAYDGLLDEVRLYDQALTPLQIKELASMIHHRFSASPSVSRDLDVTHIERTPRINYDAVPNVPQNGDSVTWTAHIRNRGTQTLTNFKYIFYYDGNWKKTGTISSLAPGATTTVSYTRSWQSNDHYLGFVVDYQNAYSEKSERNNYRLIRTNALMVGLWVEQSVRDYFDQHQYTFQQSHGIGDEANSWEDWAQRQIDKWNEMLANARTVSTPEGGFDRVRLDQVIVVPDGSLPLSSGQYATNHPDTSDKTVDMMWGFPAPIDTNFYDINNPNGNFHLEPALVHELHHARYLVDTYGLNIHGKHIDVRNAQGSRIYPDNDTLVRYSSAAGCIMAGTQWCYDEWEIAWMNQFARQRPLPGWGNSNSHEGVVEYMTLINAHPSQNRLRVLDVDGDPLAGATVKIYRGDQWEGEWHYYAKYIDNVPDVTVTVPGNGYINLGSNPFTPSVINGHTFPRTVNFIKVIYNGQESYHWLDLPQMHVKYFRGTTGTATYTLNTPWNWTLTQPCPPPPFLGSGDETAKASVPCTY